MNDIYLYTINDTLDIPNTKAISIDNIEQIADNSIDNLYLQDILDTLPQSDQDKFFNIIKHKIQDTTHIFIQAPDLKHVCLNVSNGKITPSFAQSIFYRDKLFLHTLDDIVKILSEYGFIVICKKYINLFEYHIIAKYVT